MTMGVCGVARAAACNGPVDRVLGLLAATCGRTEDAIGHLEDSIELSRRSGDKPGLGSRIARAMADAGINFRGMSGAAIGSKFVSFIALDNADDQAKAIAALKKVK